MLKERAQKIGVFLKKYDKQVIAFSLLAGFLFDNWWLSRVDVWWNNLVLGSYLIILPAAIIAYHFIEEHSITDWRAKFGIAIMPLIIQFSFGNLFSGLIIFYSRSAHVLSTWVFVLLLAGLVIFNESFSNVYTRFRYQVALWFFLVLTYSAFLLPVVIARIGPDVFLLSVTVSAAMLVGFIQVLLHTLPKRMASLGKFMPIMGITLSLVFVGLYVSNLIPPLPLALKDASIAHNVVRAGDSYELTVEPKDWWEVFARYHGTYNFTPGEVAYAYASIFAPNNLSVEIVHEWQHYNTSTEEWNTVNMVAFTAVGGRDGGYRGYSLTNQMKEGDWRVNVKTDYGAIIGQINFTAVADNSMVEERIIENR